MVENPPADADVGLILGLGRPPGEGNGNHPSILAWRIPWTEEPGGLWFIGLQRVRHNLATEHVHRDPGQGWGALHAPQRLSLGFESSGLAVAASGR